MLRFHHPLVLPALLVACAGGVQGGSDGPAWTLDLQIRTTIEQQDLFEDMAELALVVVQPDGTREEHPLNYGGAGARAQVRDLADLEGAELAVEGRDEGGQVLAYGRSESIEIAEGEAHADIFVSRTDELATFEDLAAGRVGGQLIADGRGRMLLFGGQINSTYFASYDDEDDALISVVGLPLAPMGGTLAFDKVGEMASLDSEDPAVGRVGHSATLLRRNTSQRGRILVVGGAERLFDPRKASASAFLYDPATDQVQDLGLDAMDERRFLGLSAEDEFGRVLITGALAADRDGDADLEYANQSTMELFDPDTLTIEAIPVDSGRDSPMLAHAMAWHEEIGMMVCGGMDLFISDADTRLSRNCHALTASGEVLYSYDGAIPQLPWYMAFHTMFTDDEGRAVLIGGLVADTADSDARTLGIYGNTLGYYNVEGDPDEDPVGESLDGVWRLEGGSWVLLGHMSTPRAMHAAALLPDGRYLIAGGVTQVKASTVEGGFYDPAFALACAELFDPDSGSSQVLGNCGSAAGGGGGLRDAVVLPHIAVDPERGALVAGGMDAAAAPSTQSMWLAIPPGP